MRNARAPNLILLAVQGDRGAHRKRQLQIEKKGEEAPVLRYAAMGRARYRPQAVGVLARDAETGTARPEHRDARGRDSIIDQLGKSAPKCAADSLCGELYILYCGRAPLVFL